LKSKPKPHASQAGRRGRRGRFEVIKRGKHERI
jgi:hypothetical protein